MVTSRFQKESRASAFYRFSYDCGNRLYAAYVHALFPSRFIRDTFGHEDPKEEKLGDAVEIVLGLFEVWDSVPDCIPENLNGQMGINEINEKRNRMFVDQLLFDRRPEDHKEQKDDQEEGNL